MSQFPDIRQMVANRAHQVAERNARQMRRGDAAVHVLFAVLLGVAGALLLVHFCAAEGLL